MMLIPISGFLSIFLPLSFAGRLFVAAITRACTQGGIMIFTAYAAYFFFTENGVLDWIQKHNAENIAATMQAQKPWIEDTREFFGLVIIILVLLLNLWYTRRKK